MLKTLLAKICLILAASQAAAEPDRVSILLGSKHYGIEQDVVAIQFSQRTLSLDITPKFNEQNLGVFLTWESEAVDWNVGIYENSFSRTSIAATASAPLIEWDCGSLDVFAGLAHYPDNGRTFSAHFGDVVPIAGLQVRNGNIFAQIIPSNGKPVEYVVSFGLTFELN